MEKRRARGPILVSFTKIIAYFSLFYSIVLFFMILVNLYYSLSSDNAAAASIYLHKNNPYYILLLGSVLVSGINFYCIKKEKYSWIIAVISIFLIGFTRINFDEVYNYFS